MSWQLVVRPEVEGDLAEAAFWYESHQPGLGTEFIEEIAKVWNRMATSPLRSSRKHPTKNLRWCYPERFPYRVIYEIFEATQTIHVIAVLHAARHDRHWRKRL